MTSLQIQWVIVAIIIAAAVAFCIRRMTRKRGGNSCHDEACDNGSNDCCGDCQLANKCTSRRR